MSNIKHMLKASAESCNKCLDQTNSMRVIKCRLEISSSARLLQKYTFLVSIAELSRRSCSHKLILCFWSDVFSSLEGNKP
uniref:Uncharacterized protein n=1 Tax=Serinus canaria TaxID=9135 RepID=A0A8C9MYT9_SERCA